MTTKLDNYLRFQETALSLRGQRQQLLASNIANADTPNYQARDIDFSKALQGAMKGNTTMNQTSVSTNGISRTSAQHLQDAAAPDQMTGPGGMPLLYRTVQQGSVDNNTVDMDTERNQFADNAVRYEASLTMISAQIKGMLAAIQG